MIRRLLSIVLALAIAAALPVAAAPESPGVATRKPLPPPGSGRDAKFLYGNADPRVPVSYADGPAYDPILRLITQEPITAGFDPDGAGPLVGRLAVASATAFMISQCHAMTSYHSVFGDPARPEVAATALHPSTAGFDVNLYTGTRLAGTRFPSATGTPVIWGAMNETLSTGDDWALLRVTPCLGLEYGFLQLDTSIGPTTVPDYATYMAIGFPIDRDLGQTMIRDGDDALCSFLARSYEQFYVIVGCSFAEGQSGGPIARIRDGILVVSAIIAASHFSLDVAPVPRTWDLVMPDPDRYQNTGVGAERFLALVTPFILADFEQHGTANPATLRAYLHALTR